MFDLTYQVMISTSGSHLLAEDAVGTLIREVLPLTTILTPNLPEAKLLLKTAGVAFKEPVDVDSIVEMAKSIQNLGPKYVLLKGGHLPLDKDRVVSKNEAEHHVVLDVLYGEGKATLMESDFLKSRNTHGTGCSLACQSTFIFISFELCSHILAAISCHLASGLDVVSAVKNATKYVEAGIKTSMDIGKGSGPINHFHSTYMLPFAP